MKNNIEEIKILEEFLVNNKDLENLEASISKFNIFEAMGAIRQELRHSDFLSYLLNPGENHGFQDLFLKRFLQKCVMSSDKVKINAVEIDTADYSGVEIKREWNNIDILISIPSIKLICAIENKIFTSEHSDQLTRYKSITQREYPDHRRLFIFLSPEGVTPSDEEWVPFDYSEISKLLNSSAESTSSSLGADIYTLIKHYIAMLERHIITESPIAELCRKIYKSHKKAIDLIIEHRPDVLQDIKEYLEELILRDKNLNLILDHRSKAYIRFAPKEWDDLEIQKTGEGWTRTHRVLLYEFQNYQDSLVLKLVIGPGDSVAREKVFEMVQQNKRLFKGGLNKLYDKWSQVYKYDFIKRKEYEDITDSEIYSKIEEHWKRFIDDDLKNITDLICKIKF
jgi:hypothetical protein